MLSIIGTTHMHFMKYRKAAFVFSGTLILATIIWLVINGGPSMSVDFSGGTLLEIRTSEVLPMDQVRATLEGGGFGGAEIQQIGGGNDILLRFAKQEAADSYSRIEAALAQRFPDVGVELMREETVGPKVGSELAEKALWAIIGALIGILIYVGIRYEFRFALGAVVAILHDVFIVFGILCFMGRDLSLTVIAALLTVAGYSINDTIVVFDRIRERMKTLRKETHEHAFEIAINETLSRTIITSLTALLAAGALFFLGGEVINDFALAMMLGIVLGTYSTIYVASALALEGWNWTENRKKRHPKRPKAA
jgi:preprotein translocase subunit SecF